MLIKEQKGLLLITDARRSTDTSGCEKFKFLSRGTQGGDHVGTNLTVLLHPATTEVLNNG